MGLLCSGLANAGRARVRRRVFAVVGAGGHRDQQQYQQSLPELLLVRASCPRSVAPAGWERTPASHAGTGRLRVAALASYDTDRTCQPGYVSPAPSPSCPRPGARRMLRPGAPRRTSPAPVRASQPSPRHTRELQKRGGLRGPGLWTTRPDLGAVECLSAPSRRGGAAMTVSDEGDSRGQGLRLPVRERRAR